MKKSILLVFLFSLIASIAWGACPNNDDGPSGEDVCYASTVGGGTTCSASLPCLLTTARTVATSGQIIDVASGDYPISSQYVIPDGVTLTDMSYACDDSGNGDGCRGQAARLYPSAPLGTSTSLVRLGTGSTLSNLELDGKDSTNYARRGVLVQDDNDATITQNYIHDFNGEANSHGIELLSTQIDKTICHWCFWPEVIQGEDVWTNLEAKDAAVSYTEEPILKGDGGSNCDGNESAPAGSKFPWPINPVDNITVSYNYVENCGHKGSSDNVYGALSPYNVEDSVIHHNTFESGAYGEPIMRCAAFLNRVDIYNNWLMCDAYTDRSTYNIELWAIRDSNVYNNTANGGFSLSFYKQLTVHDNWIEISAPQLNYTLGLEILPGNYGEIYNNYVGNGYSQGIHVGNGSGVDKDYTWGNVTVRNNVVHAAKITGIEVTCRGSQWTSTSVTNQYYDIAHNVIDGLTPIEAGHPTDYSWSRGSIGLRINQELPGLGSCTGSDIRVRNNIVIDQQYLGTGYAGVKTGTWSSVTADSTTMYNNSSNDWSGLTDTNPLIGDPDFINPDVDLIGYTPQSATYAIDQGAVIASYYYGTVPEYNGSAPDRGAVETGTFYVDPDCTNGIQTYDPTGGANGEGACTGGSSIVYSTIANAAAAVNSSGSTVYLSSDLHSIGSTVSWPAEVSLGAINEVELDSMVTGNHPIVFAGSASFTSYTTPLLLLSSAAGSVGDQTISYIEFDGNYAYQTRNAIVVKSRDDVNIQHNYFHEFYGVIWAGAVEVYSAGDQDLQSWWLQMPADMGDCNDTTTLTNALDLDDPVDNVDISYNKFIDCGWFGYDRTGAVNIGDTSNMEIHHNDFKSYIEAANGETIAGNNNHLSFTGKHAYSENLKIYNNDFAHGQPYTNYTNWAIEIWGLNGAEIYNNTSSGQYGSSWYSITVGKFVSIHDNELEEIPAAHSGTGSGIGIEYKKMSCGEVYNNYIAGARWPLHLGFSAGGGKDWVYNDVVVRNNVITNPKNRSIWLMCGTNSEWTGDNDVTVTNFDIAHNVVDAQGEYADERGDIGIRLNQENSQGTGTCTLSNVRVRNNIVTDLVLSPGQAGSTYGTMSNITVQNNLFYGNTVNSWTGIGTVTGTVTGHDPEYTDEGSGFDGYTSESAYAIDQGIPIASYFYGSVPSYSGSAPDIGAIENTGVGGDYTAPTLSSPTPTPGYLYTTGTTSINAYITATDASGISGCECKYQTFSYGSGTAMSNEGSGVYKCSNTVITGLTDDTLYNTPDTWFYVCRDNSGNNNDASGYWYFGVQDVSSDIIIDNVDSPFSLTGSDFVLSSYREDRYGANYYHNYQSSGDPAEYADWDISQVLAYEGYYAVYEWHSIYQYDADAAPYIITHYEGNSNGTINQRIDGGQWNYLNTFCFEAGTGNFRITAGDAGYTIFDAIKLVLISAESCGEPEPEPGGNEGLNVVGGAGGAVYAPGGLNIVGQ